MVLKTKLANETSQAEPVALPFVVDHVRMRLAGDQIHHVRMGGRDRRQGPERDLEALGCRDQSEGREHGLVRGDRQYLITDRENPRRRLIADAVGPGHLGQHVRRPVRHHAYAVRIRQPLGHHHAPGRLGEHHDAGGAFAQRSQGSGLRLGRLGQHRVQGDDDRHREPVHQLQHVTTDLAAEDAELVLDQHDVDASVEVGGRRRVVRQPRSAGSCGPRGASRRIPRPGPWRRSRLRRRNRRREWHSGGHRRRPRCRTVAGGRWTTIATVIGALRVAG